MWPLAGQRAENAGDGSSLLWSGRLRPDGGIGRLNVAACAPNEAGGALKL
jgi:hypothetical protein